MGATVAHWLLAMTLLALLVMTIVRAADRAEDARGVSSKTWRSAAAADGSRGARGGDGRCDREVSRRRRSPAGAFPLCGTNPDVPAGAAHIQMTHRILAFLLVLHLFGCRTSRCESGARGRVPRRREGGVDRVRPRRAAAADRRRDDRHEAAAGASLDAPGRRRRRSGSRRSAIAYMARVGAGRS